jgi:hypothetical protein
MQAFRYTLYEGGAETGDYRLTKNSQAVVWGQVPELRLIITISPSAIMITTIAIFLFSLRKAQNLALDHIASFDPMNPLHVIAACGSGNVQTVRFQATANISARLARIWRSSCQNIVPGTSRQVFSFSVGDINCLSGLNVLYEIVDVDLPWRASDNSAWLSE